MDALTEDQAACRFIESMMSEAADKWPQIKNRLNESFKYKFKVQDEKMAILNLGLAAIALELQAVKNLFSLEQADRLRQSVFNALNSMPDRGYSVHEVEEYTTAFAAGLATAIRTHNSVPVASAIPIRLLTRWLGEDLRKFEVEVTGVKEKMISPPLVMVVGDILVQFDAYWKKTKQHSTLQRADLPEGTPSKKKLQIDQVAQHLAQIVNKLGPGKSVDTYEAILKTEMHGGQVTEIIILEMFFAVESMLATFGKQPITKALFERFRFHVINPSSSPEAESVWRVFQRRLLEYENAIEQSTDKFARLFAMNLGYPNHANVIRHCLTDCSQKIQIIQDYLKNVSSEYELIYS